jgi:23S rRNA (guanine2445-N2)-methyltransferase / 23S rRNA (guanine2069-N7)-methyltransferase
VVHFFVADVSQTQAPVGCRSGGLVATNPPYGERIGQREDLDALYRTIGNTLERRFAGWRAAVLTADPELSFSTGMRAVKTNTIYNGALKCVLAQFEPGREKRLSPRRDESPGGSEGARMFANRLRKNARSRRRWASRNDLTCYRVYDADMPEYAAAIDFYEGMWVHLQEYAPPPEIEPETAQRRLEEMIAVVPEVLDVDPADVYVKQRKRQRGSAQYEKIAERGEFRQVHEGGNTFLINLTDYLDTGIFLDHRPTRRLLRTLAKGQDFLNLFCYTATATVYAAQGGARSTVSVDSSRTYLEWAEKNLGLNGYPSDRHRLVRDDCMAFLAKHTRRYGLIFVDPPTFSNTKSSRQDFVLQRDHGELIRHTAALLTQGGILIFSTNFQRFSLDESAMTGLQVTEITAATVPEDFRRTPHVHRAWRITREE